MDLISIPACAMYRSVGTVIVRIRMEVQGGSCGGQGRGSDRPVHGRITSGCERCNRNRLISKHSSECDSVVGKCRPYRSRMARSRYVNVCAAVCLLLLVGGLSPQSSAAPHRSDIMDRQRRQTGENPLWYNPCDYGDNNGQSNTPAKEFAPKLAAQAKSAFETSLKYKDSLAKTLHSFDRFDDLLRAYNSYEWLRKFSWYRDEVLPKEKMLNSPVSDPYLTDLMTKVDEVLPAMYKGLKMIVAGLHAFSIKGLDNDIETEAALKVNINQTLHDTRAVLCYFHDYMKARNLEIMLLPDSEVPEFSTENHKLVTGLLLYRDTLNYLEYISSVFKKIYAA